ncbi:hypothetical protein Nmel_003606, partial [Mimus melanotis]
APRKAPVGHPASGPPLSGKPRCRLHEVLSILAVPPSEEHLEDFLTLLGGGGGAAPSFGSACPSARPPSRAAGTWGGSGSSSAQGGQVPRAECRERGAVCTGGEAFPGAALPGRPAAGDRRLRQRLRRDPAPRQCPGGHQASAPGWHLGVGAAAQRRPCAPGAGAAPGGVVPWLPQCRHGVSRALPGSLALAGGAGDPAR